MELARARAPATVRTCKTFAAIRGAELHAVVPRVDVPGLQQGTFAWYEAHAHARVIVCVVWFALCAAGARSGSVD